jgi:hypothetical protein
MDLRKIIQGLQAEKVRLEKLIITLEEFATAGAPGPQQVPRGKRGRKSMGLLERKEVSARMTDYWASRRRARAEIA